ncbi:MAG TPA: ABC transporter transmembrane domain-containing protein, partial [Pedococcus sp.]|nr:ABC transporter transmembrane domain-containing protein [Pedococcus sp.]
MSVDAPVDAAPSLLRSLRIVGVGIRREPRWFALAVAGSTIYGVMTVLTAWAIGKVTREQIQPAVAAGHATAQQLLTIFGWVAGIVVINVVGVVIRRIAAGYTMYNVAAGFRREVTRQYLRLPLSWHHRHPSGQLLSNANADVEATWNVFAPLPMALGVIIMLVAGIVQMVLVDPVMALIGLTVFPALFLANLVFQRAMSPRVSLAQQLRAEVSEVAHESFEAALIVKSMGREAQEARRFEEVTRRLQAANVEVGRTRGTFDPVIEAIPTLGTLAVLVVGTHQVANGSLE